MGNCLVGWWTCHCDNIISQSSLNKKRSCSGVVTESPALTCKRWESTMMSGCFSKKPVVYGFIGHIFWLFLKQIYLSLSWWNEGLVTSAQSREKLGEKHLSCALSFHWYPLFLLALTWLRHSSSKHVTFLGFLLLNMGHINSDLSLIFK